MAVKAGLASGDLCYPLLYAPELLKKEFNSKVADMKNSVKDRSNAQCSCAGHLIFCKKPSESADAVGASAVSSTGPGAETRTDKQRIVDKVQKDLDDNFGNSDKPALAGSEPELSGR